MSFSEEHRRNRGKNLATLWILLALAAALIVATVIATV